MSHWVQNTLVTIGFALITGTVGGLIVGYARNRACRRKQLMRINQNKHLTLETYIDTVALEARFNSSHVERAKQQLIAFIEANYTRKADPEDDTRQE